MLIVKDNQPRFLTRSDYEYAHGAVAVALERCGVLQTWLAIQEHPDKRNLLDAWAWHYVAPRVFDPADFEIVHYDNGISETLHAVDFNGCRHYARVRRLGPLLVFQGWCDEPPSACSHNLGWLLPMMRWTADVVGARVALEAAKEEMMIL